jgi:hypothetical protein
MVFPLINNIYNYNGDVVQIWQQDLLRKVYIKTQPAIGSVQFLTANWWKFMFKAKFLREGPKLSEAY